VAFKDIAGNKPTTDRLRESAADGSVFHAYIFEGAGDDVKRKIAWNFAKAILCGSKDGDACDDCPSCRKADHGNHEDIIYITAEGASIKDEVVEWMQGRLKKKPLEGNRNIAIIDKADTMTLRAQNRLLKTLEEPCGGNVIMLLSENAGNLTSTIRSRCILHRIRGEAKNLMTDEQAVKYSLMETASGIVSGRPLYELAPRLAEIGKNREEALLILDILEIWFRDMLLVCCGSQVGIANADQGDALAREARLHRPADLMIIIKNIEKAKKDLNMNINAGYALKSMLLGIQEEKDDKSCRHQV